MFPEHYVVPMSLGAESAGHYSFKRDDMLWMFIQLDSKSISNGTQPASIKDSARWCPGGERSIRDGWLPNYYELFVNIFTLK